FFSSRRRHTRWPRDWSSDVCSSDLDPAGNLRNWWTPEDLKNFQARAECIVNEYNEFQVEPGINTQGKLVTGEAIADLGGATIAQIGRASCRERGEMAVGGAAWKKER